MSAMSGLVGTKSSWPYLGPFFHGPEKSKKHDKMLPISLGGPMGPIHPVWALAAIHRGGAIGIQYRDLSDDLHGGQ